MKMCVLGDVKIWLHFLIITCRGRVWHQKNCIMFILIAQRLCPTLRGAHNSAFSLSVMTTFDMPPIYQILPSLQTGLLAIDASDSAATFNVSPVNGAVSVRPALTE